MCSLRPDDAVKDICIRCGEHIHDPLAASDEMSGSQGKIHNACKNRKRPIET